ncbi:MAG: tetratricopeptide repeat protein [Candidatus Hodarchaeota archaeon]
MLNVGLSRFSKSKYFLEIGEYEKALELLNSIDNYSKLSYDIKISIEVLKGRIFNKVNRFDDAIATVEKLIRELHQVPYPLHIVDCLIIKSESLMKLGKIEGSYDSIKECDIILKTIKSISLEEIRKRRAYINFIKGDYWKRKGDFNQAYKFYMQSLKLWEKLGNTAEYAHCLVHIAYLYSSKGDIDRSIEYQEKALKIAKEKNIKRFILRRLVSIGALHMQKGEVNLALDFSEKGLSLAREIDDKSWLAACVNNVALMYHQKGELDRAFEYLEEGLEFAEKSGDKIDISYVLDSLIFIAVDKGDIDKAKFYLNKIMILNEPEKIKEIEEIFLLNKAIILKSSKNPRDRYNAEAILKKILDEKFLNSEFLARAVLNLCDLLLTEIYYSNDIEILNNLELYINLSSEMANQQQSYSLLTESYILKSKFALINMDTKKARYLLTEAQKVAEQNDLINLAKKVSKEHDNLIEQLITWDELREKQIPLNERVELSKIDEQLDTMLFNRLLKPLEVSDEEPILILILEESGVAIFSFAFNKEWNFDTDLFGGFIKAIDNFSDEIFAEGLDRAKFGHHTILMHTLDEFIICYLFKGNTYPAQGKIKKFINKISKIPTVWKALKDFKQTSRVLQLKDFPFLEETIFNIFKRNIS